MALINFASWTADYLAAGTVLPEFTSNTYGSSSVDAVHEGVVSPATATLGVSGNNTFWVSQLFWSDYTASSLVIEGNANGVPLSVKDVNDRVILRIKSNSARTFTVETRTSGALTAKYTTPALSSTLAEYRYRLDVKVVHALAGSVEIYFQGALLGSWSGDTTDSGAELSVDRITVIPSISRGAATYASMYGLLVTDDDSRAYHLDQVIPDGAGYHTDFSGGYQSVDDVRTTTPYSDFISSGTVGHKFSAGVSNPLAERLTGYDVVGVAVTARARGGNAPAKVKPLVRSNGVSAAGTAVALNGTDSAAKHLFTVDPSTGLPWQPADVINIEIGVEVAS